MPQTTAATSSNASPARARRPTDAGPPKPTLSVVVPCYNEQDTLTVFAQRMLAACEATAGPAYEIILVNDGSRDRTWQVISSLSEAHSNIVGMNLARNHGHQLAVSAGMSIVRGDWILIIDADLQDPPELLIDMMRLGAEGYEVVYAKRRTRADETRFKLATAKLFYRLLGSLSEVDIPQDVGDFRLISRRIAERLNAMPEQDRFIRGMVAWLGGGRPKSSTTATPASPARPNTPWPRCCAWPPPASPDSRPHR